MSCKHDTEDEAPSCDNCDGEGSVWSICPYCAGTGEEESGEPGEDADACPECSGTGEEEETCPDCHGSGLDE